MWACTYGIDRWIPATLVGRLTAKLVVVNLVKLHLTKFRTFVLIGSYFAYLSLRHWSFRRNGVVKERIRTLIRLPEFCFAEA